jgi:hypothetical protein
MAMARPIASGYVRHSATRLSSWLPTIATCGEVATRVRNVPHSPKASGGRERSHPARNRWAVSWLCQVGNGIAGLRCEAAQPSAARSGAMPSRAPSNWATPGMLGVCSVNSRHRDRTRAATSSTVGAHRIDTVRAAGSSMLFSSASAPRSVIRSTSSITMTCHRPSRAHGGTANQLAHLERGSVRTSVTSGCAPDSDVRHAVHFPQPPEPHCSAVAKARAAFDRPEPGGPVNNQAWLMACGSPATARYSVTIAAD